MSNTYTRNPSIVTAAQFAAAVTPWPDGVDQCEQMPNAIHCHVGGMLLVVADGSWIVTDDNGSRAVLDDATFRARYTLVA